MNGSWGWAVGRVNRQSTDDFQDSETILYDTIVMDTFHYIFYFYYYYFFGRTARLVGS